VKNLEAFRWGCYAAGVCTDDDGIMLCPFCGGHNTHHAAVTVHDSGGENDDGKETCVIGSNVVSRPATREEFLGRRNDVVISFWCETCPAVWDLQIVQHKGSTLFLVDRQRTSLDDIESTCESPIEVALLRAIVATGDIPLDAIRPQHVFGGYRLDFAILHNGRKVCVEADGHDYHERTKEQASHDRARDRALTLAGWSVLRFTGSEIYRDAGACASQVVQAVVDEVA